VAFLRLVTGTSNWLKRSLKDKILKAKVTFEIMAGSSHATWSASWVPVQTPLKRRSAISLKKGFWCDMVVVAQYGADCRDHH